MKVREENLRKMINEELQAVIDEGFLDRMVARAKGAAGSIGGKAKELGEKGVGAAAGFVGGKEVEKKMQAKAAKTAKSTQSGSQAKKVQSVMGAHMKRMATDLEKLGLLDEPRVGSALKALEKAVASATKRAG